MCCAELVITITTLSGLVKKETSKMFPKRIFILLKFFDAWGYCTESSAASKYHHKFVFCIYSIHIFIATLLTVYLCEFCYGFLAIHFDMINIVNKLFHYLTTLMTYWLIIIESHSQRKRQKQFWQVFQQIDEKYHRHTRFILSSYLFKFIEFLIVFSVVQMICAIYFAIHYFDFHNAMYYIYIPFYNILTKMYQYRVFYYLFYVEVIHFELKAIEKEVKTTYNVLRSDCSCLPIRTNILVENIKWMRNYYHLVHQLNMYLNSIFGWSQLATILCCFYFILTDLNWAYDNINSRPIHYVSGRCTMTKLKLLARYFFTPKFTF